MIGQERISGILEEATFSFARSSGPGGQHVNKTETKAELRFDIDQSLVLTDTEKWRLKQKLRNKISAEGILIVTSQESRSQSKNKALAEEKMTIIIQEALKKPKPRLRTHPSRRSIEKRIEKKKMRSEKKKHRGPVDWA
jgi:ribosome-associated protein